MASFTVRVTLNYGRLGLDVNLPDERIIGPRGIQTAAPLPELAVQRVPKDPIGCTSLAEIARNRKNACILVCDITRPEPNHPAAAAANS
jgi:nickel-dependent lactate racemase